MVYPHNQLFSFFITCIPKMSAVGGFFAPCIPVKKRGERLRGRNKSKARGMRAVFFCNYFPFLLKMPMEEAIRTAVNATIACMPSELSGLISGYAVSQKERLFELAKKAIKSKKELTVDTTTVPMVRSAFHANIYEVDTKSKEIVCGKLIFVCTRLDDEDKLWIRAKGSNQDDWCGNWHRLGGKVIADAYGGEVDTRLVIWTNRELARNGSFDWKHFSNEPAFFFFDCKGELLGSHLPCVALEKMSIYHFGGVAIGGLLVAAYYTKDKPNSTSTICLIGAGVTTALLFVHALFKTDCPAPSPIDVSAPSPIDVSARLTAALEKANNVAEKANKIAASRLQLAKTEALWRSGGETYQGLFRYPGSRS